MPILMLSTLKQYLQTGEDHPSFKVGELLTGIIADWSDQQVNGLEMVIGKSKAGSILKGCQV